MKKFDGNNSTMDVVGVALLALQELQDSHNILVDEHNELKKENEQLKKEYESKVLKFKG